VRIFPSASRTNSFSNEDSIISRSAPRAAAEEEGIAPKHRESLQRRLPREAAADFEANGFAGSVLTLRKLRVSRRRDNLRLK